MNVENAVMPDQEQIAGFMEPDDGAPVYMVNLLLISGLLISISDSSFFKVIAISMIIKMIIDLPILFGITKFVNQRKIMLYVFPMIILYPIYIIVTGALGIVGNYQWKGRKIKN